MNAQDVKQRQLEACIRKHCPNIVRSNEAAVSSFANHIKVCFENAQLAAAHSNDVENLEELELALKTALTILANLSDTTKRKLNYNSPQMDGERPATIYSAPLGPSPTSNAGIFERRKDALRSLFNGVTTIRKDKAFKSRASKRRNYEAAVVAWACKKIWHEEHPHKEPANTIHPDLPSAMADFIADVFDVLSIHCAVVSALNSLNSLTKDGPLSLSIEVG